MKWCMCLTHNWNAKSQDRMETTVFHECLMDKTFSRDTHETFCFARSSFLIHTFCAYTIYTLITHRCWWVLLRENPSHKPWELEIVILTILYTNCLCIFLNSYLSISISLRGWQSKHLPHPFRVFSEVLVLLGSIGRSQALVDAIGCIAESGELDKTWFREALLE